MSNNADSNTGAAGAAHLRFESVSRTHTGLVRSANEDSLLDLPGVALWAVADGMGGHDAGEVASKATVDALHALDIAGSIQQRAVDLETCFDAVNTNLRAIALERGGRVIGTTVVALTASGSDAACVWAGDSRLYRTRDGHLEQMTQDHALVQELVRVGAISARAARDHPAANLVTRALGAESGVDTDVLFFDLRPGDLLLLASDGLGDEALASVGLERRCAEPLDALANALIEAALDDGGEDNISVVCVRVVADV